MRVDFGRLQKKRASARFFFRAATPGCNRTPIGTQQSNHLRGAGGRARKGERKQNYSEKTELS